MSTIKVDTINTRTGSGDITFSRPIVADISSVTGTLPMARLSGTLPALNGSALTALNATQVTSGTLPMARLSGTLPALNGSALTALNATQLTSGTLPIARIANDAIDSQHYAAASIDNEHLADDAVGVAELSATGTASSSTFLRGDNAWAATPSEITKSGSDPTVSTNPSCGVGTVFLNTASGEMFVCTDATAGENVWTNVGGGSGDVQPWVFGGTVSGYSSGGYTSSIINIIDKFSFSSDGNASDVGDLTVSRQQAGGQSSSTHGYTSGGNTGSVSNVIDKFSFTTDGNATDVGDITVSRNYSSGQSSSTHGYQSAGLTGSKSNVIDKFSFSSDGNATDVGDLTASRSGSIGQQY